MNQALLCSRITVAHLDRVKEELSKIAKEYPSFGVAFDNCNLDGFPEDFFRGFNVTTFGYLPQEDQRTANIVSYLDLLQNLDSALTNLYLVYASIDSEDIEKFRDFPFKSTLKHLDLRYNLLEALPSDVLLEFPLLEYVNLNNNKIKRVTAHSLSGLENLQTLDLGHNKISELEEEAFYELFSLTHLDLSYGNFSVLPKRPFVRLAKLQSINLQYNSFTGLEEGALNDEDLPSITEIKLKGVPFICECPLQWLKLWLIEHDLLDKSEATCIIPLLMSKFTEVDFCKDDEVEISSEADDPSQSEQAEKDEL